MLFRSQQRERVNGGEQSVLPSLLSVKTQDGTHPSHLFPLKVYLHLTFHARLYQCSTTGRKRNTFVRENKTVLKGLSHIIWRMAPPSGSLATWTVFFVALVESAMRFIQM